MNRSHPRILRPTLNDAGDTQVWANELEDEWDFTINSHRSVWELLDKYVGELEG